MTQDIRTMTRESNIELLRLVLMFLIVLHHGFTPGLELGELLYFSCPILQEQDLFPSFLMNALGIVGVNTFILISGYYSIKTTKSKVFYLVCQMIVYVLLFSVPAFLFLGEKMNALFSLLIFSHSRYWFVIDYLILMILAPAINLFFDNTAPNKQFLFTLALLLVSCYLGFVWHHDSNVNGYTVFQFITLYSVGMFLNRASINIKSIPAFIIYLLCTITIASLMLVFHRTGHDSWAWILTYYNNPILVVSAISFFFIFKNLKIQDQRINRISSSSLAIYLFSGSVSVVLLYYPFIQSVYGSFGRCVFLVIPITAFIICSVAILLDQLLVSRIVRILHQSMMKISLPCFKV